MNPRRSRLETGGMGSHNQHLEGVRTRLTKNTTFFSFTLYHLFSFFPWLFHVMGKKISAKRTTHWPSFCFLCARELRGALAWLGLTRRGFIIPNLFGFLFSFLFYGLYRPPTPQSLLLLINCCVRMCRVYPLLSLSYLSSLNITTPSC